MIITLAALATIQNFKVSQPDGIYHVKSDRIAVSYVKRYGLKNQYILSVLDHGFRPVATIPLPTDLVALGTGQGGTMLFQRQGEVVSVSETGLKVADSPKVTGLTCDGHWLIGITPSGAQLFHDGSVHRLLNGIGENDQLALCPSLSSVFALKYAHGKALLIRYPFNSHSEKAQDLYWAGGKILPAAYDITTQYSQKYSLLAVLSLEKASSKTASGNYICSIDVNSGRVNPIVRQVSEVAGGDARFNRNTFCVDGSTLYRLVSNGVVSLQL